MGEQKGLFLFVTGHKLNGHNYLRWAKPMMMFVFEKGKDVYLTKVDAPPKKKDAKYKI